jgi:hypothetical protein
MSTSAVSNGMSHQRLYVAREMEEDESYEQVKEQSQDLVRIISVVYGAGLTYVFLSSHILVRPQQHPLRLVASVGVLILLAYGFYSFVLYLGRREYRYDVLWRADLVGKSEANYKESRRRRGKSALRFIVDLLLAISYVVLLMIATGLSAKDLLPFYSWLLIVALLTLVARFLRYTSGKECSQPLMWLSLTVLAIVLVTCHVIEGQPAAWWAIAVTTTFCFASPFVNAWWSHRSWRKRNCPPSHL